jgi:hypothetical protein
MAMIRHPQHSRRHRALLRVEQADVGVISQSPTVSFASSAPTLAVETYPRLGADELVSAGREPFHGNLLG